MTRPFLFALALITLVPSLAGAQDDPRHVVPIRYADRPLTLAEGAFRLDQSGVLRIGSGFGVSGPNMLSVGLTDWLELGFAWPYVRDPTFFGTVRLAHSSAVDLGVRLAVTTPAITTGDTDIAVSMPVVFRIAHIARIATGVTGDFLLRQTMEPTIRVPLSIVFSASARHALGVEGSVSLVDRHFWHGDLGIFYVHTMTATPVRPLVEVRVGASWAFVTNAFLLTLGFSFWATTQPTAT